MSVLKMLRWLALLLKCHHREAMRSIPVHGIVHVVCLGCGACWREREK